MSTNKRPVYQCILVVSCICIFQQTACLINDGITLDLDIDCGKNITDIANVTFITDVDYVKAVAFCYNRMEKELIKIDEFRSFIEVSYPGQSGDGCEFMRTYAIGVEVFTVNIEVASVVNGTLVLNYEDVFSMTCSFGTEMDEMTEKTIDDSRVPAVSLPIIMGTNMTTTMMLDVVAYDGTSLTGKAIPIGRIIRLTGVLKVTKDETSPTALNCKALSQDEKSSYDILIGGCGDGRIFPKDYGFSTINNTAYSPYFKAFRMEGNAFIKFQCTFTACTKPGGCDGNSCSKYGSL